MKIIIGNYEGTIYPEGNGYTGALELDLDGKGSRTRLKRKGRTKEMVKDKLKEAVADLEAGIATSSDYTVEKAVRDWLDRGTKGLSDKTINDYKSLADANLIPFIGRRKLKELTADHSTTGSKTAATTSPPGRCRRFTRSCGGPSAAPRRGTR